MPRNLYTRRLIEWFNMLPEPIRTQALNNHYEFWHINSNEHLNFKKSSLKIALSVSFPFKTSPEGYEYWNFISKIH